MLLIMFIQLFVYETLPSHIFITMIAIALAWREKFTARLEPTSLVQVDARSNRGLMPA